MDVAMGLISASMDDQKGVANVMAVLPKSMAMELESLPYAEGGAYEDATAYYVWKTSERIACCSVNNINRNIADLVLERLAHIDHIGEVVPAMNEMFGKPVMVN